MSIDALCINTLRTLAMDAVQKADSGHPGLPMGAAPMAYVLWQRHLKHDPSNPHWPDRDRFVLSAGHGSMLLYGLLHLMGYAVTLDDLKAFRQWQSNTPGHPEVGVTPGVEATTGPLGQGNANAVGMAIAERMLAARYNRPEFPLFDHFTYALMGDGCAMEGITSEAASLAGHLQLGKLIVFYDSNDVTLDGPAQVSMSEDVGARYSAYGWQVLSVANGDTDISAIDSAISEAKEESGRPTLIIVKTTIGFGSPKKAGTSAAHGSPLGVEEVAATKRALGWPESPPFYVPNEVRAHFLKAEKANRGRRLHWEELLSRYRRANPQLGAELDRVLAGKVPSAVHSLAPPITSAPIETRSAAGAAQNAFALEMPELVGGDADLGGSTKSVLKDLGSFGPGHWGGRNIHFGVREHAMAAIANGICYHGGLRPFVATFLVFSDYMRPAVRLAAMNHLPVTFIWTHDSIAIGEDGPTHQPIEHLMAMRAIPNLVIFRPADAAETIEAWRSALLRTDGPTGLVFTRQKVPFIDRTVCAAADGLHCGAYVLAEASASTPKAILIGTGSEVAVALEAREVLEKAHVPTRVVSMPSMELFAKQPESYRDAVLPPAVTCRVSVECGITWGWERWTGSAGASVGIDRFGASAPASTLLREYGITPQNVVDTVRRLLSPRD